MSETLACEWCGGRFARPAVKGPRPAYCSAAHRQRSFEARRAAEVRAILAEVERLREALREIAANRSGSDVDLAHQAAAALEVPS